MSGVKRFEAHYLTEGVMGGKALACAEMVLASDYDRDTQELEAEIASLIEARDNRVHQRLAVIDSLEAERDELRAQVEAMRAALTPEALDWLRCGLSTNGRLIDGTHPALEKVRAIYAALQAKP